jgi:hypothetical protein
VALVLAQTAAAWFMTGVIWTMQVLNYPLLARVGPADFASYETAHNRRFVRVVGPGLAVALASAILLCISRPASIPLAAPLGACLLLVIVILSTAISGAPAHARLARGFDAAVHARLVHGNWVRVAAWTALGLLDLWMVARLT